MIGSGTKRSTKRAARTSYCVYGAPAVADWKLLNVFEDKDVGWAYDAAQKWARAHKRAWPHLWVRVVKEIVCLDLE